MQIGETHEMRVGSDGAVILGDVRGESQPPQPGVVTHLIKARVEVERARTYGARIVKEPTEYAGCTVEDLADHRWQFTQTMRDVAPEEWGSVTVGE